MHATLTLNLTNTKSGFFEPNKYKRVYKVNENVNN